jgi:heterotetrameric sarcosine oxidase gamma subunit
VADLAPKPRSALAGLAVPGRYGRADGEAGSLIAERPSLTLKQVSARRGKTREILERVRGALGLEIEDASKRVALDGLAVMGTAPGQWLAAAEGPTGADLLTRMVRAVDGLATVVDQSDAKAILRLWGARARDVLAKGCPLDLHERAFRPNDTAVTQIALIPCQLWQLDEEPTFELGVPLSYARSFWSWLTASAAEYGYEVKPPLS